MDVSAQIKLVVVRELAETVQIQRLEKFRRRFVEHARLDADFAWHTGLVIADSSNQVQQIKRRIERGRLCGIRHGRIGKHDALDKLGAVVECIDELGDATGVVATDEAESVRGSGVDHIHA